MRSYKSIESEKRSVRDVFFLLAIAVALALGLTLSSPALGAGLRQSTPGDIMGAVTVTGGNAGNITVELRQRSNGGDDKVLATATTDSNGNYHFPKQPSAPNDAFYYVKLSGGSGTLANWYSFPIIYLSGSDFTVPTVEMSDVQLLLPPGSQITLPSSLQWKSRRSGETYRLFIYAQGKPEKAVVDSGSLGMSTEFPLADGALAEGTYDAVVQVRDAVVGYGQSQSRFSFIVGKAGAVGQAQPTAAPELGIGGSPQNPTAEPAAQPTAEPSATTPPVAVVTTPVDPQAQDPTGAPEPESPAQPSLQLDLSADRAEIGQGESMVYKIEVTNTGSGTASGVVVTDKLPAGVTVDSSTTKSTHGSIAVEGNNVTVQIGDLAPNVKAVVEIPVSVGNNAGNNLSNQATAQYDGAAAPVNSNAYIAQVAAPLAGPSGSQPAAPPASQPQTEPQATPASAPAAPQNSQPQTPPQAPPSNPPASQPQQPPAASQPQTKPASPSGSGQQSPPAKKPTAPVPQTGGSFPIVLALLLVLVTLVARYLRGRSYRRV
ncbi:MAG: hypothetical protein ABI670_16160 [Chloroflexota bacterium]